MNFLVNLSLLIFMAFDIIYAYTELSGLLQLCFIFLGGVVFGLLLMNLKLIVKDKKIGSYKRQLEKESVSSDENAAKVKVLEQKIEVLEKALQNSLKQN